MSNTDLKKTKIFESRLSVIILSAIAFLTYSLGKMIVAFDWYDVLIDEHLLTKYVVVFFFDIGNFVFITLACLVFGLYALFFYKKLNARILISAVFILLSYPIIYYFVSCLVSGLVYNGFNDFDDFFIFFFEFIQSFFSSSLATFPLLLAAILALIGVKKRIFYIFPLAISMSSIVRSGISFVTYDLFSAVQNDFFETLFDDWTLYFGQPLYIIGILAIHIALMIFVIENIWIFDKNDSAKQDETIKKLSSDVALTYLKEKFDNGEITQEEYDEQRSIVINKL